MRHEFIEYIPEKLEEGVLYISIEYKTATHLCACGCKREVVTPISPTDWELSFNGQSVSLNPSIGNWDFPCTSHYFIKRGSIQWAGGFSKQQIEAVKHQDQNNKTAYYGQRNELEHEPVIPKGLLERLWSKLFNKD